VCPWTSSLGVRPSGCAPFRHIPTLSPRGPTPCPSPHPVACCISFQLSLLPPPPVGFVKCSPLPPSGLNRPPPLAGSDRQVSNFFQVRFRLLPVFFRDFFSERDFDLFYVLGLSYPLSGLIVLFRTPEWFLVRPPVPLRVLFLVIKLKLFFLFLPPFDRPSFPFPGLYIIFYQVFFFCSLFVCLFFLRILACRLFSPLHGSPRVNPTRSFPFPVVGCVQPSPLSGVFPWTLVPA